MFGVMSRGCGKLLVCTCIAVSTLGHACQVIIVLLAGDAAPSEVKNALDPDQGNVISAYSSDSGSQND